ncbi:putative nucleotidyltransferase [Aeromonas phage Ahp1]|uniref:Putative nucleotidyltransferase n=1 Tax=Aeromonas phage Ahp1 TaxID=1747286 RepID=A0A1S5Q8D4_9CAUD|nr:nucleotidyltransferase [Aeromonas phage Ahp1]ALP47738.1 putative nucleotidyltransferase [Aeromonas phage Ahp1]
MYQKDRTIPHEGLARRLMAVGSVIAILEGTVRRQARLVGGAVRDIYKNVDPHDFDIAVVGDPDADDADNFETMCKVCDAFSAFDYKTEVHQAYDQANRDFNARWAGVVKLTSPVGQQYDILFSREDSILETLNGFDCTFNQCFLQNYDSLSGRAQMMFLHSPNYEHQFQLKPVRYERRQRLEEIAAKLGYTLGQVRGIEVIVSEG